MWKLRSKLDGFIYNFRWSDYVDLIDGPPARAALAIPLVGYLILFNDWVANNLTFQIISGEGGPYVGMSGATRLQWVYFGLFCLATASVIYRWRRPFVHKFGRNFVEFSRVGLETFTTSFYVEAHGLIRQEGHRTLAGKYYDSTWDGFLRIALGEGEGTQEVSQSPDWERAKRQYEHLLRGILEDYYFRHDITNRLSLFFGLLTAGIGYALLIGSGADIFIKVVQAIIL
jgi:hypothetical protein